MFKAPAFMFPTTTIMIDDDQNYLNLFINAVKDVIEIKPLSSSESIYNQRANDLMFVLPNDESIIKIKSLLANGIKQQQQPFEDLISVVIADQLMEPILGSSLLNQLKSPFVRKIIISNAIKLRPNKDIDYLHNNGFIHAVLDKTDNLSINLPVIVWQNKIDFFSRLSSEFFSNKENPLADSGFADILNRIINDFKPDYLWPSSNLTSFCLVKTKQKTSVKLYVSTADTIEAVLDSHRSESASQHVISMLKSREFCFAHDDPIRLKGHLWEKYLKPAKKISGQLADYYICIETEAEYV